MQLGTYSLGDPITAHLGAQKFSWWDNRLERRKVPGETLYRAAEGIDFLDSSWYLVLGVFQQHIYKLSARFSTTTEADMETMVVRCADYCNDRFGSKMSGSTQDAAMWETSFGKVTLNIQSATTGSSGHGTYVVFFEATAALKVAGEPHGRN